MKAKAAYTVIKNGLVPKDERAHTIQGKLKLGSTVLVTVHLARNPQHNALAHKIYDLIADAKGVPPERVKFWLKYETGHVEFEQMLDGKWGMREKDFSFESLDQEAFQDFWNHAVSIISERLLPDAPPEVYEEIRRIIAGGA